MPIRSLGHIVLRVRDLDRAKAFYCDVLGIKVSARAPHWNMLFLTIMKHHDIALVSVGETAVLPDDSALGLDHVAFELSGGVDELRAMKARLEAKGIRVQAFDHGITKAINFADPDGNQLELYVDMDKDWKNHPELIVAETKPLDLSAS